MHSRDIISIFFNTKVCCVFSIVLPHRGDSNEYTQHTIINIKKKNSLNYPKSAARDFFKAPKNKLETATVNESSMLVPLNVFCKCSWGNGTN